MIFQNIRELLTQWHRVTSQKTYMLMPHALLHI